MAEKVWITSKHINQISHRALYKHELRNREMFDRFHEIHASWDDAHAAIVRLRGYEVQKAENDLIRAKASLKRAKAMTPKAVP